MLWPLTVVLVANTNGRLAIPALAGLLVLTCKTVVNIFTAFTAVLLAFQFSSVVQCSLPARSFAVQLIQFNVYFNYHLYIA